MTRTRTYRRKRSRKEKLLGNPYLRLGALTVLVIIISSFYIYQRVWVRSLISEVEDLQAQNESAGLLCSQLESQWMTATSISAIETRIKADKLGLRPTTPTQNLVLEPNAGYDRGRYAGLLNALDKLKSNIPLVTSSEAEAGQLFESE